MHTKHRPYSHANYALANFETRVDEQLAHPSEWFGEDSLQLSSACLEPHIEFWTDQRSEKYKKSASSTLCLYHYHNHFYWIIHIRVDPKTTNIINHEVPQHYNHGCDFQHGGSSSGPRS